MPRRRLRGPPRPGDTRHSRRVRRWLAAHHAAHPLCAACLAAGVIAAAEEVDHITPLADGGSHDASNLQSLCRDCHLRKTAAENAGRGRPLKPRPLFLPQCRHGTPADVACPECARSPGAGRDGQAPRPAAPV